MAPSPSTCVWSDKLNAMDASIATKVSGLISILNPIAATATASITYSNFPAYQEIFQALTLYVVYNYGNMGGLNGAGADPGIIEYSQDQGTSWTTLVSIARLTADPEANVLAEASAVLTVKNPALVWVRCTLNCNVTDTNNGVLAEFDIYEITIEETI